MWKALFLVILALIIAVAAFLVKPASENSEKKPGQVLADTAKDQINNFFDQTKDSLQETSQNLIDTVKDQTYNQAQNTVNTVFDKPDPTSLVTVNILGVSKVPPNSITIDFLNDTNLKLNLNKGIKYYLQFKNIPLNYCLYISDNKYQVSDNKLIELQFNSSGTYPIRLNSCEVNDKNLGELVVQ